MDSDVENILRVAHIVDCVCREDEDNNLLMCFLHSFGSQIPDHTHIPLDRTELENEDNTHDLIISAHHQILVPCPNSGKYADRR